MTDETICKLCFHHIIDGVCSVDSCKCICEVQVDDAESL